MMSHEVEKMAYVDALPWHGLGTQCLPDLTPAQFQKKAGLDWTVEKIPAYATIDGKQVNIGKSALVRSTDHRLLSVVSNDWNPLQNSEAFEFFNEFIEAGDMEMHTAGSLKQGELVWALAKVKESFSLFQGKDVVDSYLLFTNPHKFGKAIDIRFTPTRVVCWNTISLALSEASVNQTSISHRVKFDKQKVLDTLGMASSKFEEYHQRAVFLSKHRAKSEDIVSYFKRIFPVLTNKEDSTRELSKNAKLCLEVMDTQPGAELGRGSWWQCANAVTFTVDHLLGRSDDTRTTSAWYNGGATTKVKAINEAIRCAEMSEAM
jgi:phage/plasmid-like protein (TIGR03299 family)